MAKLTVEDKKKIIDLYKEGYGALTISRKINIGCARIREILRKYDLYGDAVIEVSHKKRKYTVEFKIYLINRVFNGESIISVANKNMIGPGQLSNWIKKYKEMGYNSLSIPQGRPRIMKHETKKVILTNEDEKDKLIRELKERNAQLEMENDLLKKLKALVQQRTQQPNKKK